MRSPGWRLEAATKIGRCAMGGALLLCELLTAAPVDAKPGEGTPTQVAEPADPARRGTSVVGLAVSITAGPSFARSKSRYDSWDWSGDEGRPSPDFDSQSAVTPGGALTFTLGGRVGSRLLVGGGITVGGAILPNRFTGETELKRFLGLGPEIALLPNARRGVFAFARSGVAFLDAFAWSGAVGGGYALPFGKTNLVGLGLELSGVYSRFTEDGDWGIYTYKDEVLASELVLRFML